MGHARRWHHVIGVALVSLWGLVGNAWAAQVKLEAGSRETPLTPQQTHTLTQQINALGGAEKIEVRQGRLEANVKNDTLTAPQIQGLVTQLRETGTPFEVRVKGAHLTADDITALRNQFAGQPVAFRVQAEKGIQMVRIEVERHEGERHEHAERAERHERVAQAERPERVERPERAERPERVERPERPERVERPEIEMEHEGHH